MKEDPLVVTVEEAAGLLGISRGLVYILVHQGTLPSIRLGRRVLVPRRRLQQLVDSGKVLSGSDDGAGAVALTSEKG